VGVRTFARRIIPVVTALPGQPVDGQEVYYVADGTARIQWHLRYRAAASGWEYMGGGPLASIDAASVTRASSSFGDFSTPGPSVTAPLAGDYMVDWSVNLNNTASSPTFSFFVGIKSGSTDPADADCLLWTFTSAVTTGRDSENMGIMRRKVTVASASDVLKIVARGDTANSISVSLRWLAVTPLLVN
jgi:hypothetical protein